jgi:rSAM/selenodomain-associated transferase 1
MAREFGIFAKYWQPGEVKTRLAAHFGVDRAAGFHRVCLETLLRRFAVTGDRRVLAFAPSHRERDFAALAGSNWPLQAQSRGDLGKRMSDYFWRAFAAGASAVVLIGSDSPTVPDRFVAEAFEELRFVDAVVGPADDGGYYLIGLSRYVPSAFQGISWSTPEVFRQTTERLRTVDCRCHVLLPWYDIDTPQDLARLRAELATEPRKVFATLRQTISDLYGD